ncbi:substrate-binding periplasmic protein [Massilia endophytica]|uniref:substrate-binding periplasmic protein n=1 Tax=Massilia endophytica TaxID=2899220 RepID=UPI001E39D3F0|nr:transporter substrate-binding domain-containing protein [Massilia endophytica]UGQ46417.1 transporter substrate-binding domain-containing protein [Massilia endophytica]
MTDRRQILGLALALGALPPGHAEAARKLRIVTSHLPPLVYEKGQRQGALVEIVRELCRIAEVEPDIGFFPWPRALFMASKLPATAIFPLTRNVEREGRFRWLAPLYDEHYVFLAPRGGSFDTGQPSRMRGRKISLLRGAVQAAILRELGYENLVEASTIDEVHRFLVSGIADAAFGERNIIGASLKQRGAAGDFAVSAPIRSLTAWLAGSPDMPESEAERFSHALSMLKSQGRLQKIYRRYDLEN